MHTATHPLVSFNKRSRKGFGLLEVILVFAIVIGAAAVVFTVFQSAKPSADASNEASNLTTIATNLKSTYGINHNYNGLSAANAISAKAIPASMVNASATNGVSSQWGDVNVVVNGTDATKFDIVYSSVPSDACAKFVTGVAGFFPNIVVGAGTADVKNGVVSTSNIITDCSTTDPVATITFTGN